METKPKDNAYHAVVHIMKAATFAKAGMHHMAHEYARKAYHHAQAHRDALASHEKHEEIAKFNKNVNPMFTHLEHILSKIPKPQAAHEKGMIDRIAGTFSKKKLTKSFGMGKNGPMTQASPGRIEFNRTGVQNTTPKPVVNTPKNTRLNYKPFHELSPNEQVQARHAFSHSPEKMENYHYGFEPKSNQMVHGQRWLPPKAAPQASTGPKAQVGAPAMAPQANAQVGGPGQILPQHMSGAQVTINAPGHPAHGTTGIVQTPNPLMEGKVRVKINSKGAPGMEDVHVNPAQVSLKRQMNKSEPDNVVLLKSAAVLKRIKSQKEK